ncbi:MAG TPA: TFIIB-type zinc ribbon-containing protein, partial [Candidatus Paceibacterota bacterium]|nr:TFIIB-type zinc ribbon-containing protein [Candidatus Paceibacterota bacterium]
MCQCPECKNTIISDSYRGDTICESCGLVVGEKALDISNFDKNMFSYEEIRDRSSSGFVDMLFTPAHYFNTIIKRDKIKNKN